VVKALNQINFSKLFRSIIPPLVLLYSNSSSSSDLRV